MNMSNYYKIVKLIIIIDIIVDWLFNKTNGGRSQIPRSLPQWRLPRLERHALLHQSLRLAQHWNWSRNGPLCLWSCLVSIFCCYNLIVCSGVSSSPLHRFLVPWSRCLAFSPRTWSASFFAKPAVFMVSSSLSSSPLKRKWVANGPTFTLPRRTGSWPRTLASLLSGLVSLLDFPTSSVASVSACWVHPLLLLHLRTARLSSQCWLSLFSLLPQDCSLSLLESLWTLSQEAGHLAPALLLPSEYKHQIARVQLHFPKHWKLQTTIQC